LKTDRLGRFYHLTPAPDGTTNVEARNLGDVLSILQRRKGDKK
jgi:hypothetical protein